MLRVNQLDAVVLDSELHGLLKTQLGRACSGLPAGTLERFRPEVDALFNLLMFRFSVWMQRPTPGMHLQGLRYRNEAAGPPGTPPTASAGPDTLPSVLSGSNDQIALPTASGGEAMPGTTTSAWTLPFTGDAPTKTQRLLHGLLSVGVQWGFARLRRHGLLHGWGGAESGSARHLVWHILRRLETLFRIAWMINLLLFLRQGEYATPVDRLVQMRMVNERIDSGPRPINYQFLNRRLLWDHWAKMAYVVAPLINWGSIRRAVTRSAGRVRREARALGLMSDDPTRVGDGIARLTSMGRGVRLRSAGSGRSVALTACAECGTNPAKTPYVTDCGHVLCYYCARMACTIDPLYACPSCGESFASSRRWSQPR